jgi:hypothetical protein
MTRNSQNRNIAFNQKLGPQIKNILHCCKPAAVSYILTRIGAQSRGLRAWLWPQARPKPWPGHGLWPGLAWAWLGLAWSLKPGCAHHYTSPSWPQFIYFIFHVVFNVIITLNYCSFNSHWLENLCHDRFICGVFKCYYQVFLQLWLLGLLELVNGPGNLWVKMILPVPQVYYY